MKETISQKVKIISTSAALDPSFVMDGTAHTEISSMRNIHYSREIIKSTEADTDLDKLRTLKKDKQKFLKWEREMLNRLCGGKDALGVHDDALLIKVGIILSEIKTAFKDVK